ncbi:MAG: YceI family protein [Pirellulaceae bacterium]|nr:YceI family protein [Pirellulaceae bacterium]
MGCPNQLSLAVLFAASRSDSRTAVRDLLPLDDALTPLPYNHSLTLRLSNTIGQETEMRRSFTTCVTAILLGALFCASHQSASAADDYEYDLVHSSVSFKARHLDISWIHGRFNDVSGMFSIDRDDPSRSTFALTIQADSVDTANEARDKHLRQPDYFDTKQYPTIEFKSTSVKPIDGGFEVTGDFTMHGTTKEITLTLMGGKEHVFKDVKRVAFSTEYAVKRSDYGFDKNAIGPIGDKALIMIDCEGVRK